MFKARNLTQGILQLIGRVAGLRRTVSPGAVRPPAPQAPVPVEASSPPPPGEVSATPARRKAASARKAKPRRLGEGKRKDGLESLLAALAQHPRRDDLVSVGKEKDQLLRSLVPLFLARDLQVDVNSGLISRFWKAQGLTFAPPNAAKALRNHVGYARATKAGQRITPNGIRYVEEALARKAA